MNNIDITKEMYELAEMYQKVPTDRKEGFWSVAKSMMGDVEFNAFATMLTYFDWLMNTEKAKAIRDALGEKLYKEFLKSA